MIRHRRLFRLCTALLALFCSVILLPFSSAEDTPEYRALWVDSWNAGFSTAAQIDQMLAEAKQANINVILPQVRRRGDAFYESNFEPKSSSVSPSSFDPLGYLIEQAHAADPPIEVHAWIIAYPVGSSSTESDHILNAHPDWLMETESGDTTIGGERWVDPAHPGVQQHTRNVALDIVSRYDVDGLHYDYIRYPNRNSGYNPVSVARFNERFNRSGTPSPTDSAWLQFRRDAISELVRRIYLEAIAIDPALKISAATIGQGNAPSTWTNSTAYIHRLQDWNAWMQEGIIDINMPMLYFNWETDNHQTWWNNWIEFAKNHKHDRHLAIGAGWYINTVSNNFQKIEQVREPSSAGNTSDGVVGYHYAVTNNQGVARTTFFNALASNVFTQNVPTPEMPWKTDPPEGHVMGNITDADNGNGLDGATVTLSGPRNQTLRADATGFYGSLNLPPGSYTVEASMPDTLYEPASGEVTITAGEVASLDLELEWVPEEDIIINHPDADLSGSWDTATFGDAYDAGSYRLADTVAGNATATAAYTPGISAPGIYDIYAWWTGETIPGRNTSDARHEIVHTDGTDIVSVDQTEPGSGWVRIAEGFHFSEGDDHYVNILNTSAETDRRVVAGAIRFVLTEPDPGPDEFFDEPIVYPGMQDATIVTGTMEPSSVQIEYGISESNTSVSDDSGAPAERQSVTFDGLEPGTTYQARAIAQAGNRTFESNWFSFETMEAVIVDNMDSEVTFSGSWDTADFGTLFYGENYHRSWENAEGATATFTPSLPVAGRYDVYTWYPSGSGWGTSVPHTVSHAGGEVNATVDQDSGGGGWELLVSNVPFNAGNEGYVRITNNGSGTVVVADAHRWVLVDSSIEHSLQVATDGDGTIERTPSAEQYDHGSTVELTAEPAEGWFFSQWTGDIEDNDPSVEVILYEDMEVTAVFEPLLQVTTEIVGEGSIELDPDEEFYPFDSTVLVTATPADGYAFSGWGGDITDLENPSELWIDDNKHVVAVFEQTDAYRNWVEQHFDEEEINDEILDPLGDFGNFGIANLLRYAFELDPRNPDPGLLPSAENQDGRLAIAFRRRTDDDALEYRIEISADLTGWDPAGDQFVLDPDQTETEGEVERVVYVDQDNTGSNKSRFVRVRVVRESAD